MYSFQIDHIGQPAVLREIALPDPGPGEIRVKIEACGLNFADLLMETGQYQDTPEPPFGLGMEVSGTVDALGPGVSSPRVGTRVAAFCGHGGLAEFGCFSAEVVVPIPETVRFVDAAAMQIAYGTSHVALRRRAALQSGETLLVLGAAGGVGLTAVEIGALLGARVIACARGPEKLKAASNAGAHHLIDSGTEDIRSAVKALGGADVVFDPVGGAQFNSALRACRPEARILSIGFASGEMPQIKANHLLVKNLSVIGVYWGGYPKFDPSALTASFEQILDWHTAGKISPHVSHVLPLPRAREGLELIRDRVSTGKVVITCGRPEDA